VATPGSKGWKKAVLLYAAKKGPRENIEELPGKV
jgi:hypothetical protein